MQSTIPSIRNLFLGLVASLSLTATAHAQLTVDVDNSASEELVIAVPGLPTQQSIDTPAGSTSELGGKISDVIVSDLRSSGLFKPIGRNQVRGISYTEVTAPQFPYWSGTNASALIQGFIRANADGKLTVGCYLYDVALETELTRQGFVVEPRDWRRAAHKCADAIYSRLSGESPFFDRRQSPVHHQRPGHCAHAAFLARL